MSEFCPVLWPEEPTPENVKACKECGLYKHGSRMVWGEGNPDAPILILLDNPGSRENREGNPFVCGTRQTLQKAANHAGLAMHDLYVTFILKRKPVRAYDKKIARTICMNHLEQQLQVKQPTFIFCLGNVAVQSFFRDRDADVKSLRGALHHVRGYQTATAYHPLAVRRRPNLWKLFLEDWQYLANCYYNRKNIETE
ncbi:uracil-DNA glycosylase [Lentibacillus populi]|uniref:Uracil-DNA glycosylase n=1 Tax=Lentibacillus populi TaxID=1827502 RepID=A0A9W5TXW1_9BACI|nr:uracil-DNA glycosylase [Lentibacillus populi]MBT2217255.1 uracil-DNA glycosylase [Virgibacillus dakarensis]GGB42888.1 uracil-DNA glycosylase [Lentibacillus populi]